MRFSLSEVHRVVRYVETESRMVGARGQGENRECMLNGARVSVLQDGVLEMDGGEGCTI